MNSRLNQSLTLFELLIAIVLLSLMVLGFASIDLFSRHHVLTSERRAQVQNEVSFVLEHMAKNLSQAIGSSSNPGIDVDMPNRRIRVRWDRNSNGRPDDNGPNDWIVYIYNPGTREIGYNESYSPPPGWPATTWVVISNRIITPFTINYIPGNNYVDIDPLTACWDPASTTWSCGAPDNPTVTMRTRIKMPSVSTN